MKIYIVLDTLEAEALMAFSDKKEAHQWAVDQELDPSHTTVQACQISLNWAHT